MNLAIAFDILPAEFIVTGTIYRAFLIIVGFLALVLFLGKFLPWLRDFRHELRYLNSEIGRTRGQEKERWKERKRKLYLSILPFFHY